MDIDMEETYGRFEKERWLNQRSKAIWLVGLSGSGKTTLAENIDKLLHNKGFFTKVLDGDLLRLGLNNNLGFSLEDRAENMRRVAEVTKLFIDSGVIPIVGLISPTKEARNLVKQIIGEDDFLEIYLNASLESCEKRDTKGLYQKARSGDLEDFTGISSPFEAPKNPHLIVDTVNYSPEDSAQQVVDYLLQHITFHKE